MEPAQISRSSKRRSRCRRVAIRCAQVDSAGLKKLIGVQGPPYGIPDLFFLRQPPQVLAKDDVTVCGPSVSTIEAKLQTLEKANAELKTKIEQHGITITNFLESLALEIPKTALRASLEAVKSMPLGSLILDGLKEYCSSLGPAGSDNVVFVEQNATPAAPVAAAAAQTSQALPGQLRGEEDCETAPNQDERQGGLQQVQHATDEHARHELPSNAEARCLQALRLAFQDAQALMVEAKLRSKGSTAVQTEVLEPDPKEIRRLRKQREAEARDDRRKKRELELQEQRDRDRNAMLGTGYGQFLEHMKINFIEEEFLGDWPKEAMTRWLRLTSAEKDAWHVKAHSFKAS